MGHKEEIDTTLNFNYDKIIVLAMIIMFNIGSETFAQKFEGVLTYKVDVEVLSKFIETGMTKEQLIDKMKNEGSFAETQKVFYGKDGFYRTDLKITPAAWSIYRPDSNKIYTFRDSSSVCVVTDASIDLENRLLKREPQVSLLDTIIKINDKLCKIVRVKWKSGYYDYFFSENYLKMDSSLYKGHICEGWFEYLKIANCLPVQIIKTVKNIMKTTYTLRDVEEIKINSDLFLLPPLIQLEQNSLILNQKTMKIVPPR